LTLLATVNYFMARRSYPVPFTIVFCLAFTIAPACIMLVLPAVALQALFLCILLLILVVPDRGRKLYRRLSWIATLVAYVIVSIPAVERRQEEAQLRQEYPFESIDQRLSPTGKLESSQPKNPEQLNHLEERVEREMHSLRSRQLRDLHERSVKEFVNSPGFGVSRGIPMQVTAESLKHGLRDNVAVPQPDYFMPFTLPMGSLSDKLTDWNADKMGSLHEAGVLDFLNPNGFGYVKDRKVAGFQSHGMSKVQDSVPPWQIARIDLVSLLVHEKPVAYVSSNLPKMDELRKVPTRPLDAFEAEGLQSLKNGEDLFVRGTDDKVRMVGSIRAAKQCIECHGGKRGDLLGAFSYGFRREEKQ
jgi:hypothetical protein